MSAPAPSRRAPARSLGSRWGACLALAGGLSGGTLAGCAATGPDPAEGPGRVAAPQVVEAAPFFDPVTGPLALGAPADGAGDGPGTDPAAEDAGTDWTLDELVRRYAQIVDVDVEVDPACAERLAADRVELGRPLWVEADRVQAFAEALLDAHGYVLVWTAGERSERLRVTVADGGDPGWLEAAALPVPLERVESLRAHKALLVAVELELPATDVAQICTALSDTVRWRLTEAFVPVVVPVVDVRALAGELEGLGARRHRDPETGRYDGFTTSDVPAGSSAARCGFEAGDVIKRVNGHPVTSAAEAANFVKNNVDRYDRWEVVVERRGREITLVVSTRAVLVLGTGRQVAERVALLREVDALNAAHAQEAAR